MRPASAADAPRNVDRVPESLTGPGAEPIAMTHDNIPHIVVLSTEEDPDLPQKSRFAGKLADLPAKDLVFLATIDERNH